MMRQWQVLVIILCLIVPATTISTQDDVVTISMTVPHFMEDIFKDEVIARFEDENPGIRVHIVNPSGFGIPFSGDDPIEDYLDAMEDYVASADIVLLDSDTLLPEATRAGYLLDLLPLVNTDAIINPTDFYPPVWQSFQWDGGMWAIPLTMDVMMLFYNRDAFDAANQPYPTETWTMYDYEATVRALAKFNADGSVAMPGWINSGGDFSILFLASINDTVYDFNTLPNMPRYNNPELETVLEILAQMYRDGLMDIPEGIGPQDVPLQLGLASFNSGRFIFGNNTPKTPALLPRSRAGLVLNAFAISSGTQHPEAAYKLLQFLSYSPEAANAFFNGQPARLSLEREQPLVPAFAQQFLTGISADTEARLTAGFQNAMPVGETRFARYLEDAVSKMVFEGVDARTALDEIEQEVLDRLNVADARRDAVNIVVEPPPPPVVLQPGEIRLTFGLTSFIVPPPNAQKWENLALEFVFNDPEVGDIIIDVTLPDTLAELSEDYDCFYLDANAVPSGDLSLLRSIDPLLDSDPMFDPDDIIGNALVQVQRNNQTWAMPLIIQPAAMRFNPDLFAYAGAMPPGSTAWTVDQFEDALRMLKAYLPADEAPYQPHEFGNSYLLMLIAAYGGLPFDYRTDPVTISFTDTFTVAAIRRVLDLARDGYIDYRPLASVEGFAFSFRDDAETALYSEVSNVFTLMDDAAATDRNTLTLFPQGSHYAAVSYDVGAAYISTYSQHAEACYRFISALSQQPDLFDGMPARRSHLNNYELQASQGMATIDFYLALDALMQQANTICIPALQISIDGITKIISTFWLNRAFDRYVLQDADLITELEDAERYTQAYFDCTASIPPFDPAVETPQVYFGQFAQCAFRIDPTVMGFFSQ